MTRRALYGAVALAFLAGCGESVPPTPSQQALRELRAGHYNAAIAICGEAVRLNPQDAEAYLYRARAYHYRGDNGDLERAIADFGEAIRTAPQEAEAYYGRSLAYRDLGNANESAADEKRARELDAQVREVYAQLPDITPPAARGKAESGESTAEALGLEGTNSPDEPAPSEANDIKSFMRLKERFEPGWSDARSQDEDAVTKASPQEKFLPLLSKPRYTLPPSQDNSPRGEDSALLRDGPPGQQGAISGQPPGGVPRGSASGLVPSSDEPAAPISPWQRRGSSVVDPHRSRTVRSPFQTQFHSPFPQSPPRPTGFVEEPEPPSGPVSSQPRQYFNRP